MLGAYRGAESIRLRQVYVHRISFRCYNWQSGSGSKDYYSILGIKPTSTQREIKSAYYALSKKYHPDVAGSSAENKFHEISEAYETLKDSERRRHFDNMRTGARAPRYTGDHGYQGDPFEEFYRRAAQQQQWQQQNYNSSRSRRYNQQDYERIWKEFRRMSNEREKADAKINWERQRVWEEFARKRAERWQEFHRKYPNGAPGDIRWEWKRTEWKWENPGTSGGPRALLRRIVLVYLAVFTVVTIVQVIFQTLGDASGSRPQPKPQQSQEKTDRDRILAMMNENPAADGRWMPTQASEDSAFRAITDPRPSSSFNVTPSSFEMSSNTMMNPSGYGMGTELDSVQQVPSYKEAPAMNSSMPLDGDAHYPYGMPSSQSRLQ